MLHLLLLLLLRTVYAEEPGDCYQDDISNDLVDPSCQEDEDDMPEDLEETHLNFCQLEKSHNISLEGEATCHYRLYTHPRRFPGARRFCRCHGGNLCSIHNACVNHQLRTLAQSYRQQLAWIGVIKPRRKSLIHLC
ncbi:proteoglycan 3-like [Pyxicephalus adspersus]|uniref:proteoglycan 3-like n=1 Tax=Pyxicephalus adspersus TaxID=30357 RepID=UPI003B5C97DC